MVREWRAVLTRWAGSEKKCFAGAVSIELSHSIEGIHTLHGGDM